MKIQLLGSPDVRFANGLTPALKTAKAEGLLYYLAATRRTHSRAALATLFWGDMEEAKARVNLSKALSELREQLSEYITIATQTVAFNAALPYQLDVETFLAATGAKQASQSLGSLQAAVDLYQGDFLDGFHVRNAPEFEQWLTAERERLRTAAVQILSTLAARYRQNSDAANAIGTLRRLLVLEPWREEDHIQLMDLLAASGETHAALRQYELCRLALAQELDVEPGEEITRLYTRLKANPDAAGPRESPAALPVVHAAAGSAHLKTAPPHNLPHPSTAFVGRAAEIQALVTRLQDPACRLLTLVGPGGIGKTRLALEVARNFIGADSPDPAAQALFPEGVFFAGLMSVDTEAGIVSTIAEVIGFSFYSDTPPAQQLFSYLKQRTLLLVLDNFEHLAEASSLLPALLSAAPGAKLLVTSRTALPLQSADLHTVQGLSYPPAQRSVTEDAVSEDAVRLFVQSARRQQGTFAAAQHLENIVAICRLVSGMPLALELAAAWLKSIPCAYIVRELEKGMALLHGDLVDLQERHRNMQMVFEQTWQRLTPEEAGAMARLAIFRGGFTLHAAEEVAQTSPYQLAALVDNALIRLDEFERYQIHELLRQFAHAKLAASEDYDRAAAAHAQYFLTQVTGHKDALCDSRQPAALAAIQAENDNMRTAWLWAMRQPDVPYIAAATDSIYDFYRFTCRYSEGKDLFAGSAVRLYDVGMNYQVPARLEIASRLATRAAVFAFHLGDYEQAAQHFQSVLAAADNGATQDDVAIAHTYLGFIEGGQGHFLEAECHLQTGVAHYEMVGDRSNLAAAMFGMSDLYTHAGWFQKGVDCARRCLLIGTQLGRADLLGNAHSELAHALKSLGYPKLALEHYRQGCVYSEKSGDRLAYAMSVGGVGIELCQLGKKQWAQGFALIEQSLAICQELGHSWHIVTRLYSLQQACNDGKRYAEALPYAEKLLQVATAGDFRRVLAYCYLGMAESYFGLGDLALCRQHLQLALRSSEGIEWNYPALSHVVVYYALLLEREAAQLDREAGSQYCMHAVTLAAAALRWPGWRAYHRKAEQLLARQQARLTAAELAATQAAAEHGTLEALVAHAELSLAR